MKIALVNPNVSVSTTEVMVRTAADEIGDDGTVEGVTAPRGAALITTPEAMKEAAQTVVLLGPTLVWADAVVIAAFGDPGLTQLRNQLPMPVTGIGEAGMAEAGLGGRRFAVVTTTPDLRAQIAAAAARYGHREFAGVWITQGDPVKLTADPQALQAALRTAMKAAVIEGGAQAVLIGGGPLARAARALASDAPVPVIEPVPAAIRLSLARVSDRGRL